MQNEGPQLEVLTHRLADCPEDFLLPPTGEAMNIGIHVEALAADHFRALGVAPIPIRFSSLSQRSLVALAVWMLHDEWFLKRPDLAPATAGLMSDSLFRLADVVTAQQCVRDPDRREEFARHCLARLELRPRGETIEQAQDRYTTMNSIERDYVMREMRAKEARARQVREQMAKRAAEEAAAKTTRE